jgi:hypothetical protein
VAYLLRWWQTLYLYLASSPSNALLEDIFSSVAADMAKIKKLIKKKEHCVLLLSIFEFGSYKELNDIT